MKVFRLCKQLSIVHECASLNKQIALDRYTTVFFQCNFCVIVDRLDWEFIRPVDTPKSKSPHHSNLHQTTSFVAEAF